MIDLVVKDISKYDRVGSKIYKWKRPKAWYHCMREDKREIYSKK